MPPHRGMYVCVCAHTHTHIHIHIMVHSYTDHSHSVRTTYILLVGMHGCDVYLHSHAKHTKIPTIIDPIAPRCFLVALESIISATQYL